MEFAVNTSRIDPYRNFKFRVNWDGTDVAGVSKVSGLKRTTEIVEHRDGRDVSTSRKSPGRSAFEGITLERGITHDHAFEEWANLVYSPEGDAGVSLRDFRKDLMIDVYNLQGTKVLSWQVFRCWVTEFTALPELDANANVIIFESVMIAHEGFQRDVAVVEPTEF